MPVAVTKDSLREDESQPLPFADLAQQDWYAEAARYVYVLGLMRGNGEDTVGLNIAAGRAMVVTSL